MLHHYPKFRLMSNFYKDECGAAFIELTFLLVFLLVPLFIGLLDLGTGMYEWKMVNDALQAQVLFVTATEGTQISSNAQQLNSAKSFVSTSIPSINAAGAYSSTHMPSTGISFKYETWCGCASSGQLKMQVFSDKQPYCPQPPNKACDNTSYWGTYVTITANHIHKSIFNLSAVKTLWPELISALTPTLSAHAIVRIN